MWQPDEFRRWMCAVMAERRMTQRMLAMRSGVDHSTISRIASGERIPSLHTAQRVAAALDHPMPLTIAPVERMRHAIMTAPDLGPDQREQLFRSYLRLRDDGRKGRSLAG